MTQEEKQLLLKDLCARLAYNPFCKVGGIEYPIKLIRVEVDTIDGILLDFDYKNEQGLPLQVYLSEVKPYLRPMSSMTEEEGKHYNYLLTTTQYDKLIDWLNEYKFDYRYLIPIGLALEAPNGMYN